MTKDKFKKFLINWDLYPHGMDPKTPDGTNRISAQNFRKAKLALRHFHGDPAERLLDRLFIRSSNKKHYSIDPNLTTWVKVDEAFNRYYRLGSY